MDLGTGGGFPGLPLAIFYPDVEFVLVDSIAKKIRVVDDIREKMNLKNVQAVCARAESIDGKFDFVVTRAVAPLIKLNGWGEREDFKQAQSFFKERNHRFEGWRP